KDRSDFEMYFVQGIAEEWDGGQSEPVAAFRRALAAYKSCKPRNLMEAKVGATTVRYIFEGLRKGHEENSAGRAREELTDALYNGLEEELALAAVKIPWLAPLIKERTPAAPEPPAPPVPEVKSEPRPAAPVREILPAEVEPLTDGESSCRLI